MMDAGTLCALRQEIVQNVSGLPNLTGWRFHPVHRLNMKFININSGVLLYDSTYEFDTLTTRVWSLRSFARMRELKNLTKVVWEELCKVATVYLWTAYQCAETLFICLLWMWDAVGVGCQPQQWRYAIILTPQVHMTQYPKIWAE